MSRLPFTITVRVPGAPLFPRVDDEQGNATLGPDVVSNPTVKAFAPRESVESAESFGGQSITGGTVYGYRGTVIPADAIISIRGVDYQMDGELGEWVPAYTYGVELATEGVQFAVKRVS